MHAPQCSLQHDYNNQDMETAEMSFERGMDKADAVHTDRGILLGVKERGAAFQQHGWTRAGHTKQSASDRGEHHTTSLTCGTGENDPKSLFTKQKQTHGPQKNKQTKLVVTEGGKRVCGRRDKLGTLE